MNKRHYEHMLPNIRGSLSNTYIPSLHRPLPSLGDGGIVGAGEARADARR